MRAAMNLPAKPGTRLAWNEAWLLWLLCGFAAFRVLAYSLVFPFFSNVDEEEHFDLVLKYSEMRFPTGLESVSPETISYIVRFSSPEYLYTPDQFAGGKIPPPPSSRLLDQNDPAFKRAVAGMSPWNNQESSGAPLYYALAGIWTDIGRVLGVKNLALLCWIRLLNLPLIVALVWLGYACSRLIFPERRDLQMAVPFLLAFLPQDIYYTIQSDNLSALCFGAAFLGLIQWLKAEGTILRHGLLTGLALAAAWLAKTTNVPLVAVVLATVVCQAIQWAKTGKLPSALSSLALLLLCAAIPIGAWCLWSRHAFGDPLGAGTKIQVLGWSRKPFADWWRHPIFTLPGFLVFWSELMASFWRGELVWGRERLASPSVDAFYWASSLLFPAIALASLVWKRASVSPFQRGILWLSAWIIAAGIGFLAFDSIIFDFGKGYYPSQAYPYFSSGRLMIGALIPFLLLYVYGLEKVLRPLKNELALTVAVIGIVLMMTISEYFVNLPAFSSPYNWFHY
jgi:hypothetical protein